VADRVAAWFVPAVIVVAILAFLIWATVGPDPRPAHALIVAVALPRPGAPAMQAESARDTSLFALQQKESAPGSM
jgi:hypothetical protein